MLMEGLKNWERTPTIDSSSGGTSDNPETDASDEEDEPTTKLLRPLTFSDLFTATVAS